MHGIRYAWLLALLLLSACQPGEYQPRHYRVRGIDVSHYQSRIDWDTVVRHTPLDFIFVKATEGVTLRDSFFCENWEALERTGTTRGAYHFFRPSYPAKRQAYHFIDQVMLNYGDLPPVLDVEVVDGVSKVQLLTGMITWLGIIESHYGIRPIIYTNQKFYNKYLSGYFEDYSLWIARYNRREPQLVGDNNWDFWQYADDGRVPGIPGPVDFNVFYGTPAELDSLRLPDPFRLIAL